MIQIFNGGIEAGLLALAEKDGLLNEADKERLNYLESLPKMKWVTLDKNGQAEKTENDEQ